MRWRGPRASPRTAVVWIAFVLLATAAAAVVMAARPPPTAPAPPPGPRAADLPLPAGPGLDVPVPTSLRRGAVALWAGLRRGVVARAAPRAGARAVVRLGARTPEGTANLVVVVGRPVVGPGGLWVRVRLPTLSADSLGWVPRAALGGYGAVRTRLRVDLTRLRLTLVRDGRVIFRAPVAVGAAGWPTPTGEFYVRNRLTRYRSPVYGPLAFGTSARSRTLTDWPAGGFIGIHGTNRPDLVPGRVSHGCIRMRNEDILRLGALMPIGTPVSIR